MWQKIKCFFGFHNRASISYIDTRTHQAYGICISCMKNYKVYLKPKPMSDKKRIDKLEEKCKLYKSLASELSNTIQYREKGINVNSPIFDEIALNIERIGSELDKINAELQAIDSEEEKNLAEFATDIKASNDLSNDNPIGVKQSQHCPVEDYKPEKGLCIFNQDWICGADLNWCSNCGLRKLDKIYISNDIYVKQKQPFPVESSDEAKAGWIASKYVSIYLKGKKDNPANHLYKLFIKAMHEYASQRVERGVTKETQIELMFLQESIFLERWIIQAEITSPKRAISLMVKRKEWVENELKSK
jgi:hypothetical protein